MSDNRRDQLIEFVEREFIGPDPIDWPGMTQNNGQEILVSDPPRTRYIAGILYPAETTDDKADLKDGECESLGEADGEDVEVKPPKRGDGAVEFLEDAERLTVGAIVNDDFLMIKTTCGNAVLISENEWRILIDVFKMMINRDEF